ncbi:MAG: hypothetical protein DSY77_02300 [Bacteroidetes bacterium]|nr:MAG: hypothetical protein DSY77_02300 [Bacteroidota bacterium]
MKIGIIIVTYNGEPYIESLFASLKNETIEPSIVVVDNDSSDDTLKKIRTYSSDFKDIKLIELDRNTGFGYANNIGIKYLLKQGMDYISLVNQDISYKSDVISKLCVLHKSNRLDGIISPFHLNGQGDNFDLMFYKNFEERIKDELLRKLIINESKGNLYIEVKNVNAAFWVLNSSLFNEVGLFSKLFRHYGEDNDFVNRLKYLKKKVYLANSLIYHNRKQIDFGEIQNFKTYLNKRKIFYLVKLLNINYSISRSFYLVLKQYFVNTLRRVVRFQFSHAFANSLALITNIWSLRSIRAERKMNIKQLRN